ncbi:MAG: hypothetical protein R3C32_13270 [Chloroflexota bacterium]
MAGPYERALRVLGGYIDQQQPRDVFLMEQEGSWLLRLLMGARTGMQHVLVEFTPDEIAARADHAPALRRQARHDPASAKGPTLPGRIRRRSSTMRIIKLLGAVIGLLVAAAVVVPLALLAGLFIWLKLTEDADEEPLELEQEQGEAE